MSIEIISRSAAILGHLGRRGGFRVLSSNLDNLNSTKRVHTTRQTEPLLNAHG